MKVTVIAQLMNEQGNYHEVEVELGRRHRWKPRFMGIALWKEPTPQELLVEAAEDAVSSAESWLPGTWTVWNMEIPETLASTGATPEEREATWQRVFKSQEVA